MWIARGQTHEARIRRIENFRAPTRDPLQERRVSRAAIAFETAAAALAVLGAAVAFRPGLFFRRELAAPAREAALIAGTMTMALGLAAILFVTTYHFSVS